MLELLSLAGSPHAHVAPAGAELDPGENRDFAELLTEAYARALGRLLGGSGLRGLHARATARLRFRVRGRVLVAKYVQELPRGRPEIVPCTFATHTIDNDVNRALRWALHLLLRSAQSRSEWTLALGRLDARFSGVRLQPPPQGSTGRFDRLPEAFAQYTASGALPIASFVLRNLSLGSHLGDTSTVSLAYPAHRVFERAFAAVMARLSGLSIRDIAQPQWLLESRSVMTHKASGTFKPDIVIPPGPTHAALVIDTKWKSMIVAGAADVELTENVSTVGSVKINNGDVFQALAYVEAARRVFANSNVVGALIYPIASDSDSDLRSLQLGVQAGGRWHSFPLHLIPWNVGTDCVQSAGRVWETLRDLRGLEQLSPSRG